MGIVQAIIQNAPLVVAPIVLVFFSVASAYVWEFRLHRGGLGFDYIIFALVIIVGLVLGGAI